MEYKIDFFKRLFGLKYLGDGSGLHVWESNVTGSTMCTQDLTMDLVIRAHLAHKARWSKR